MRKIVESLILLVCITMLTSCVAPEDGEKSGDYFTETKQARDIVFNCLVERDDEGIKELLCERLKNVSNLDEQIQNLLDSIDGNISFSDGETETCVSSSSSASEHGIYTKMYSFGEITNLSTDTDKTYQHLLVFYCYVDQKKTDMEGVYAIVLRENDDVKYEVCIPEEEPEVDYGTIYTPDGQHRPATKEEYDALHGDSAVPFPKKWTVKSSQKRTES